MEATQAGSGGVESGRIEEDKLLLERAKFFRDHVQAVLSLATGALVLSVTFLHDKPGIRQARSLRTSWILLLVSIFLGVAYNYVLAIYTRPGGKRFGPARQSLLQWLSLFFHASFLVALVFLACFGLANI